MKKHTPKKTDEPNKPPLSLDELLIPLLLLLIGLCLLLFGYLWKNSDTFSPAFAQEILISLGCTLIIAVVLIFTIERYAEDKRWKEQVGFRNDVARDAFFAIFQNDLPREILKEVMDTVIRNETIRENFEVTYSLSNPNNNGHYPGTLEVKYTVRNITIKEVQYEITGIVDLDPLPDEEKVNLDNLFVNKGGIYLPCSTILKPDGRAKMFKYSGKETILGPLEEMTIKYKMSILFPDNYHNIWVVLYPTINFDLSIIDKSGSLLKQAKANHTAHSIKSDRFIDYYPDATSQVTKLWKLTGGILPYQGIQYWWRPRS
jgi:hypothetical protein